MEENKGEKNKSTLNLVYYYLSARSKENAIKATQPKPPFSPSHPLVTSVLFSETIYPPCHHRTVPRRTDPEFYITFALDPRRSLLFPATETCVCYQIFSQEKKS